MCLIPLTVSLCDKKLYKLIISSTFLLACALMCNYKLLLFDVSNTPLTDILISLIGSLLIILYMKLVISGSNNKKLVIDKYQELSTLILFLGFVLLSTVYVNPVYILTLGVLLLLPVDVYQIIFIVCILLLKSFILPVLFLILISSNFTFKYFIESEGKSCEYKP